MVINFFQKSWNPIQDFSIHFQDVFKVYIDWWTYWAAEISGTFYARPKSWDISLSNFFYCIFTKNYSSKFSNKHLQQPLAPYLWMGHPRDISEGDATYLEVWQPIFEMEELTKFPENHLYCFIALLLTKFPNKLNHFLCRTYGVVKYRFLSPSALEILIWRYFCPNCFCDVLLEDSPSDRKMWLAEI